jgi:hypothetical protein
MSATDLIDPPPDWAALAAELHCPLCEYNLRGLVEPRCPECGFAFTWSEILCGQQEMHPYIFEHHPKRNIWSFWKTYWNDCRPWEFWLELSPAQPVRMGRLMIYWAISSLLFFIVLLEPVGQIAWVVFHQPTVIKYPVPAFFTNQTRWRWQREIVVNRTPSGITWVMPKYTTRHRLDDIWALTVERFSRSSGISSVLVALLWPWLSLPCLLIFIGSMRKANIKKRHLLRVIVYGTDYGFLILIPLTLAALVDDFRMSIFVALICGPITLHRIYFGYKDYLRFHMPFATVLSSQIMVFLVFLIVYLQTLLNHW